jgi:acyl carrier protein
VSDLATQLASLTPAQKQLLALRLRRQKPALVKRQPIPRRTGAGPWPLTYEQQRLWFVQELFPAGAAFNVNCDIRLRGSLRLPVLLASLGEMVRRHEILRSLFVVRDGVPGQTVRPAAVPAMPLVDLSALPPDLRAKERRRRQRRQARRPFVLAVDGPLRLMLLRLAADDHVLLVTVHHVAADWWSSNLIQQELGALYQDLERGQLPALPEPPIQFADFAVWQRSWLPREIAERGLLAHWRELLAGAPVEIDLPRDRPRPPVSTYEGARLSFLLLSQTADGLRSLARGREVTLFLLILAAYAALLSRVSRQNDFLVGTPVADRSRPETRHLLGCFLNHLIIRVGVGADCSFEELLLHTRGVVQDAYAHQDMPFGLLLDEIKPERSLNRPPIYQAAFLFVRLPAPRTPEEAAERGVFDPGTSRVDLTLVAEDIEQGGLRAFFEYSTELFDRATLARLAGHFQNLLAGAAAHPERRVSELPLLSAAERAALLYEWNDATAAPAADPANGFVQAAIGAGPPTLGRPLPQSRVYVLDPVLQPVPIGIVGEIWIGGTGVGRGYRGRPDLSAERFLPDPFASGCRVYRTGDLGRRRPDGTIELTPTGKIDRGALPAPQDEVGGRLPSEGRAPRSALERQIAEIWREILGIDEVPVNMPFFVLGGTSLLVLRLRLRLREALGLDLPTIELFRHVTVAALAEHVSRASALTRKLAGDLS